VEMTCALLIVDYIVHIHAVGAISLLGCIVALCGALVSYDSCKLSPCPSYAVM
jgi:hypothetical protein